MPDQRDLTQPHICFPIGHDRRDAQRTFYKLYGVLPSYTIEVLWVGPIPQEQASPEEVGSDD